MIPLHHNESRRSFFHKNKIRLFYRSSVLLDFFRGTNFYKAQQGDAKSDGHHFATAFYPGLIGGIFRILPKHKIHGLIEVGSGKGLGIVKFKRAGISRVGGIEIQESLVTICHENLKKVKINADFIYTGDAQNFYAFEGYNTLFIYNSLPCNVLIAFLSNYKNYINQIQSSNENSMENETTANFLIYVNPVYHENVIGLGFEEMNRFFHFPSHETVIVYQYKSSIQ